MTLTSINLWSRLLWLLAYSCALTQSFFMEHCWGCRACERTMGPLAAIAIAKTWCPKHSSMVQHLHHGRKAQEQAYLQHLEGKFGGSGYRQPTSSASSFLAVQINSAAVVEPHVNIRWRMPFDNTEAPDFLEG